MEKVKKVNGILTCAFKHRREGLYTIVSVCCRRIIGNGALIFPRIVVLKSYEPSG
jgi:hypothetical protein